MSTDTRELRFAFALGIGAGVAITLLAVAALAGLADIIHWALA